MPAEARAQLSRGKATKQSASSKPKHVCGVEGCENKYSNATDLSRHKWIHVPEQLLPRCPFRGGPFGWECDHRYQGRLSAMKTHWDIEHKDVAGPWPESTVYPKLDVLSFIHGLDLQCKRLVVCKGEYKAPSEFTTSLPVLPVHASTSTSAPAPSASAKPAPNAPAKNPNEVPESMRNNFHWSIHGHKFGEKSVIPDIDALFGGAPMMTSQPSTSNATAMDMSSSLPNSTQTDFDLINFCQTAFVPEPAPASQTSLDPFNSFDPLAPANPCASFDALGYPFSFTNEDYSVHMENMGGHFSGQSFTNELGLDLASLGPILSDGYQMPSPGFSTPDLFNDNGMPF